MVIEEKVLDSKNSNKDNHLGHGMSTQNVLTKENLKLLGDSSHVPAVNPIAQYKKYQDKQKADAKAKQDDDDEDGARVKKVKTKPVKKNLKADKKAGKATSSCDKHPRLKLFWGV